MEPKEITPGQVRAVNVTLGVRGLADDKEDIISAFTNGRTTHITEMRLDEARALLMAYNKQGKSNDLMLRKIFAMAHEMGWIKQDTVATRCGNVVSKKDYSHVYAWVEKYGYLKKELRLYNHAELTKLVSQFEFGPYKHYLNNL